MPDRSSPSRGDDEISQQTTEQAEGSAWSGYGSDQGEPGDAEDFQGSVATSPGDDRRIKADVCAQIVAEPDLDARDIDVDVLRGEVVLQGSVGSEAAPSRGAHRAQCAGRALGAQRARGAEGRARTS